MVTVIVLGSKDICIYINLDLVCKRQPHKTLCTQNAPALMDFNSMCYYLFIYLTSPHTVLMKFIINFP